MKLLVLTFLFFLGFRNMPYDPISGTYKVKYDQNLYDTNLISITFADSTYEKTFWNGKRDLGKIIRWHDANKNQHWVRLIDNYPTTEQGKLDRLAKKSFGTPVIEFLEGANDTLKFRTTYAANLHITLNEGRLIRDRR